MSLFKKNEKLSSYTDEYLLNLYKCAVKDLEKFDVDKLKNEYDEYRLAKHEIEKDFYRLSGMKMSNYDENKLKEKYEINLIQINLLISDMDRLNNKYNEVIINYQNVRFLAYKVYIYEKEIKKRKNKNKIINDMTF